MFKGRVKRFFNFDRHFSNLISRGFISSYLWRCLGVPTSTIGWKREKISRKEEDRDLYQPTWAHKHQH